MSNVPWQETVRSTLREVFPDEGATPAQAKIMLAAATFACAFVYVWLWEATGWAPWILLGGFAAVLFSRSAAPLGAALVWGWFATILADLRHLYAVDDLQLRDVVLAAAFLASTVFALRFIEAAGPPRRGFRLWRQHTPGASPAPTTALHPFSGVAVRIVVAVGVALLLLTLLPLDSMAPNTLRLAPAAYRMLLFFWGGVLMSFVLSGAFALVYWRRLTARQAALHVRQIVVEELRTEQGAIERRRKRIRASSRTEG